MAANAYVPSTVDGSVPEQRIVEQACRLRPGGAVTGWASLRLAGAGYFDGLQPDRRTRIPVPLVIGPDARLRDSSEVALSRDRLEPAEVVIRHGVPSTVLRRALFDEMRRPLDWRESVVAMDMAAAAGLVSVRQMREYVRTRAGWRGTRRVRGALELASERSGSPAETRLRLVWICDAGLPGPLVNQEVFDRSGRLVCVADLFDREAGMVVEYDGSDHRTARRHSKDVAREEACRRLGLEYVKVTGLDIRDPALVVDRLTVARRRARFLPSRRCAWTLTPPEGWQLEESLDDRLDTAEWLAARLEMDGQGSSS